MYEYLPDFLIEDPDRMVGLGRVLVRVGGFVLVVGFIGHSALGMVSTVASMGAQTAAQTLGELYPSIPTWWIPESIVGCLPAALVVLAGGVLVSMGKKLKRIYF